MQNGKVRPATDADIKHIEAWLPTDRSIETLAMNWNITLKMFKKGAVSVWEDGISNQPVAYCWGSLNSDSSILEVHPEYRGLGIGRAMANFMIEEAISANDPLLEIEIAPISAELFWQKMGFQTRWEGYRCIGRRVLELRQPLTDGISRSVTVEFLPENALWSTKSVPVALETHNVIGRETFDGKITLEKCVAHFYLPDGADLVIDVMVDGRSRYRGKAKYQDAKTIGVKECMSGFMIGEILPNFES